jgi:hypothetical protein
VATLPTVESLEDRPLSGFRAGSGGQIVVGGARTTASVIIPPDFETAANETIEASFNDSSVREQESFAATFNIKVTECFSPAMDHTISLNRRDRTLFSETEFLGARVLTSSEQMARGKWVTISIYVETYAPGTHIFMVVTSLPRIIGQTTVDRDGSAVLTASVPLEAIGPGAHRIRVIGERVLGGVSVDDKGQINISDETVQEIKKFDTGTTAIARIRGVAIDSESREVVRYIPLREPTPWYWMLIPLLTLVVLSVLRRQRRLLGSRFRLGLLLASATGLVPAWIGWSGLFFDLATAGLLAVVIAPVLLFATRVRRLSHLESESGEPPMVLTEGV